MVIQPVNHSVFFSEGARRACLLEVMYNLSYINLPRAPGNHVESRRCVTENTFSQSCLRRAELSAQRCHKALTNVVQHDVYLKERVCVMKCLCFGMHSDVSSCVSVECKPVVDVLRKTLNYLL